MATDDRFSLDAGQFTVERDTDPRTIVAASQGTYRSNWSRLKTAAYSTTYCCIVNMNSNLLPLATRVCENNSHAAERAFLLSVNHGWQVGGPALGAISLVAFAQESFVRLSYQVAVELRLQRGRQERAKGLDRMVASTLAKFDKQIFAERCRRLLEELRASAPRDALKPSIDLMSFRNTIAHDSPLLSTSTGREQSMVRGSPRERPNHLGAFLTLESEMCPVRLRHVKAAIDAHDHLVGYCFRHSARARWDRVMEEFSDGIGFRLRDAFKATPWYQQLNQLSRRWERQFQPQTDASFGSHIEMRTAIVRRAEMRRGSRGPSNTR